jgi:TrmH family RNA methyltransferase
MLEHIRIVLVGTSHPGNIGSSARAMKVMGLSSLHLVTPKIYPSADATAMASGADDVLQKAVVHDSLDSALAGCPLVLGTSARLRSLPMPMIDARRAAGQALAESAAHEVAVLFGRERYGLVNEEMQRCQFLVNIPSNPAYSSLNLAQAVQVTAYECRLALVGGEIADVLRPFGEEPPAGGDRTEGMFEHLEQALVELGYLDPAQPKRLMSRLRRLLARAQPSDAEVDILRGIAAAIIQRRAERVGRKGGR